MVFPAHINLLVGSACQNALCSADDSTKAETAAVRRLSIKCPKKDVPKKCIHAISTCDKNLLYRADKNNVEMPSYTFRKMVRLPLLS